MKRIITSILPLFFAFAGMAQISQYQFIREGGQLFELDPNDTNVTTHTIADDMVLPAKVKIGYNFKFNGAFYDSVGISENGFIWFGPAQPSELFGITNPMTAVLPAGVKGVVCAFGIDLHPRISGPATTIRSGPQYFIGRIDNFIIEWKNTSRFDALNDVDGADTMTIQMQLFAFEDDRVQITYGYMGLNANVSNNLSVGIKGASNTDFATRMTDATHTWDNTIAGTSINSTCLFSKDSNPMKGLHNFITWVNRNPQTGTKELDGNSFNIYPMPVTDVLYIQSAQPVLSYAVYNIAGKLLTEGNETSAGIAVSHLTSGFYFVKLTTAIGTSSKKFIKN
ncbi:MAG: T9SS type A sorting domain-containing protein [Bacteroidota bacterium]